MIYVVNVGEIPAVNTALDFTAEAMVDAENVQHVDAVRLGFDLQTNELVIARLLAVQSTCGALEFNSTNELNFCDKAFLLYSIIEFWYCPRAGKPEAYGAVACNWNTVRGELVT